MAENACHGGCQQVICICPGLCLECYQVTNEPRKAWKPPDRPGLFFGPIAIFEECWQKKVGSDEEEPKPAG
jgi:hypothetical protein